MPTGDPDTRLGRSLESGRVHSAYLLSGDGERPRRAAIEFARGLACAGSGTRPCEACPACRRSAAPNDIAIDGSGRSGPLFRHIGDHPDLIYVERGSGDTRVRIAQIRAVQGALRLRANEGGRRAAVIADAEWLNQEAQNALLRLLEEPPPETTVILVATTPAGLLATVRSRCQRVPFPSAPALALSGEGAPDEVRALAGRIDAIGRARTAELLDWAEEYRGPRARAAEEVARLLEVGAAWLRARAGERAAGGEAALRGPLDAFAVLSGCRKALAQRNANPQMVAERALLALRDAASA